MVSPPSNVSDVSSQSTRPSFLAMKPSRLATMWIVTQDFTGVTLPSHGSFYARGTWRFCGGTSVGMWWSRMEGCTMLTRQVWSPYAAGIVIGLLQIPAFLLIETALGTSTAFVTVGRTIASWIDPSIHVAVSSRNWWQVALLVGTAIGAFMSMRLSG